LIRPGTGISFLIFEIVFPINFIIYPEDGGSRFLRNIRKYCDVTPESWNSGVRSEAGFLINEYLTEHVPVTTGYHVIIIHDLYDSTQLGIYVTAELKVFPW
jgi:hypothetical protein